MTIVVGQRWRLSSLPLTFPVVVRAIFDDNRTTSVECECDCPGRCGALFRINFREFERGELIAVLVASTDHAWFTRGDEDFCSGCGHSFSWTKKAEQKERAVCTPVSLDEVQARMERIISMRMAKMDRETSGTRWTKEFDAAVDRSLQRPLHSAHTHTLHAFIGGWDRRVPCPPKNT